MTSLQIFVIAIQWLGILFVAFILGKLLSILVLKQLSRTTRQSCRRTDTTRIQGVASKANVVVTNARTIRMDAQSLEQHLNGVLHV